MRSRHKEIMELVFLLRLLAKYNRLFFFKVKLHNIEIYMNMIKQTERQGTY